MRDRGPRLHFTSLHWTANGGLLTLPASRLGLTARYGLRHALVVTRLIGVNDSIRFDTIDSNRSQAPRTGPSSLGRHLARDGALNASRRRGPSGMSAVHRLKAQRTQRPREVGPPRDHPWRTIVSSARPPPCSRSCLLDEPVPQSLLMAAAAERAGLRSARKKSHIERAQHPQVACTPISPSSPSVA